MVGVDEAFKSKMKMLEELFKSKLFNLITAANNASYVKRYEGSNIFINGFT